MSPLRAVPAIVACFLAVPSGTQAVTTLGPSFEPDPSQSQAINFPSQDVVFNAAAPVGVRLNSPIDGVITRWRIYTGRVSEGSTLQLRVMSPLGGTSYQMVNSGPVEVLPAALQASNANLRTFAAQIPIRAGQSIGVHKTHPQGGLLAITLPGSPAPSPWRYGYISPAPSDGYSGNATVSQGNTNPGSVDLFIPLSAEVEADADGDLFGDETQDRCLDVAGSDRGCPPGALDPPPVEVVKVVPAPGVAAQLDPASAILSANRRSLSVLVSCPADVSELCTGEVAAKTTRRKKTLNLGRTTFSIAPGETETAKLRVPARTRRTIRERTLIPITFRLSEVEMYPAQPNGRGR